jgi:hypothetical protein
MNLVLQFSMLQIKDIYFKYKNFLTNKVWIGRQWIRLLQN